MQWFVFHDDELQQFDSILVIPSFPFLIRYKLNDLNVGAALYCLFKNFFWHKKKIQKNIDLLFYIMLVVVIPTYTDTFSFCLPSVVWSPPNLLYSQLDGVLPHVCRPLGLAAFYCLMIMPELFVIDWLQPSAAVSRITLNFQQIVSTRAFHNAVNLFQVLKTWRNNFRLAVIAQLWKKKLRFRNWSIMNLYFDGFLSPEAL